MTTRSKGYWQSPKNKREFLYEVAKKLQIQHPSGWGSVSTRDIVKLGGRGLLASSGTLLKALQVLHVITNQIFSRFLFQKKNLTCWNSSINP